MDAPRSTLREAREARGLSIREVSRLTGIERGHLSRIERGLIRPSLPTLIVLCRAVGLRDEAAVLRRLAS